RQRDLDLQWTKLDPADPANANRWRLTVSVADADLNAGDPAATTREFYVQFKNDGEGRGTLEWISDMNAPPVPLPAPGEAATRELTVTETDGSSWSFELRLGEFGRPGGVTQYASNG